jgi:hypothetical protein
MCWNPSKTSPTRARPEEDTREWGILPSAVSTENLPERRGSQAKRKRIVYVPADDSERVITACPDNDWRLVFALPRYAGVRVVPIFRRKTAQIPASSAAVSDHQP